MQYEDLKDPRASVVRDHWANAANNENERADMTQGVDNDAAFYFYDWARNLCFMWSGDAQQQIEVSHGGFGEPFIWKFYYQEHRHPHMLVVGTLSAVSVFKYVCNNWIKSKESDL